MRPQNLLIDADDTLWQNNVYFEQAIAKFCDFVSGFGVSPADVRPILNTCEYQNIAAHGYGSSTFERSLTDCYARIAGRTPAAQDRAAIARMVHPVANQAIELLPGVLQALPLLAERHHLILVTKGDPSEQTSKLQRSGIRMHFAAVEVPPEKHQEAYEKILGRYHLLRTDTWMIGNSPRSDINPALAAGLHAVYIHHPETWVLEHEAMRSAPPPQKLLQLERFSQLLRHF